MAKKSSKLGTGSKSRARAGQLAAAGSSKPRALGAHIARKKYGARADELAAHGRREAAKAKAAGADKPPPKAKPKTRSRV